MIKDAILRPNFQGEFGRMDYFQLTLVQIGIFMLAGVAIGLGAALLDGTGAQVEQLFGLIVGLVALVGVFWMIYVSVTIHVKRFRNMGMKSNSTLTIATIAFYVANQIFGFLILIPLFWPPDNKEVA